MFLDTGFNSLDTVLANLYQSFLEAAVRCAEYIRQLATSRQPNSRLLISECSPSGLESRRFRRCCLLSAVDPATTGPLANWMGARRRNYRPPRRVGRSPASETVQARHDHASAAVCGRQTASPVVSVACSLTASSRLKRTHLTGTGRLCCTAFRAVFHKRQTQHRELLRWLDSSLAAVLPTSRAELQLLAAATAGRA